MNAGHDFERGSDVAKAIIALIKEKTGRQIREDSGIGIPLDKQDLIFR